MSGRKLVGHFSAVPISLGKPLGKGGTPAPVEAAAMPNEVPPVEAEAVMHQ